MPENEDNAPVSPMVAERGIKSSRDFVDFMSALMADVVSGRIDPKVANAACVAGGHILKVAKMQIEYVGSADESLPLSGNKQRLGGGESTNRDK